MNPLFLLTLWRERWGLKGRADKELPYLRGRLNTEGERLAQAHIWAVPGATGLAVGFSLLIAAWLVTLRFSPGAQLVFSLALIFATLYVRPYRGRLVSLLLFTVSILASTRYLYWRFAETLNPSTNMDFLWGLGLGIAELYLWSLLVLEHICVIWPLRRSSIPLPSDYLLWPSIDIYLVARTGESKAAIERLCEQSRSIKWPMENLRIFLLDADPAMPWRALAESLAIGYSPCPDATTHTTQLINLTMRQTHGTLVAIFDTDRPFNENFLHQSAGWFVRDHTLALVQTPVNPIGTIYPADLEQLFEPAYPEAGALLRRTLVLDVGGLSASPSLQHALAQKGATQAYMSVTTEGMTYRIDSPSLGLGLRFRQYSAITLQTLQLYRPIATAVCLASPLAFIFFGIAPIRTQVLLLVLYGLPHWVLGYLTRKRLSGSPRLRLTDEITEALKAGYLLLPTTVAWMRTNWGRLRDKAASVHTIPPTKIAVLQSGVCFLSWIGLFVEGLQIARSPDPASIPTMAYLLWCAVNCLLLTSTLAVDAERRAILWKQRTLARLPAMLQFADGHTMACTTKNLPEALLSLEAPVTTRAHLGKTVRVSIFFERQEFDFPGSVCSVDHQSLLVQIDQHALSRYNKTLTTLFSRDQDWPHWLPGPLADHPLPGWLLRPILAASADLTLYIGQNGVLSSLKRLWLQISQRKST